MKLSHLFLFGLMGIAAAGCSKYGYVSLSRPLPPEKVLPKEIRSIAVVNRSLTSEEDEGGKVLEAIATGEIAGSDRLASDECIKGVYDAITGMEQAELVIPARLRMEGTGTRELPELLEWDVVEKICEEEGADALLVLENFDSNTDLLLSEATGQVSAILSTGKPRVPGPREVKVHVVSYWRLYDPEARNIVDQYHHDSYMAFHTSNGLLPPDALPSAAYEAGSSYIQRYLPSFYKVRRKLYKRTGGSGKHPFKAGYRRAEMANWEGAMELWIDLTEHPRRKTAGRACLNMGVASEVLGRPAEARQWAQKSYELYKDKLGRDYVKILLREGY